jgi:CheY-like chemotaxis protein
MKSCKGVVVVVEDHPLVRMSVLEFLTEAGFEAVEARSADEAIEILEARSDIHLVFTDAEMPGSMDGVALLHYIRNRWPPVKLILVSGKARIDPAELPAGVQFFAKPYRETVIIGAMDDMLGQR